MIIAFDGPDTAGKGTTIREFQKTLAEAGYTAKTFFFPGYTPAGSHLRQFVLQGKSKLPLWNTRQAIVMAADMLLTLNEVAEFLESNEDGIALFDRYFLSTYIYQHGMFEFLGHNSNEPRRTRATYSRKTLSLLYHLFDDLVIPDLYVVINADDEILNKRLSEKLQDGQFEVPLKQKAIRKAYNYFLSMSDIPDLDNREPELRSLGSVECLMGYLLNNDETAIARNVNVLMNYVRSRSRSH